MCLWWLVNMVKCIIKDAMGNFSTVRVCFKNFSTKKKIEHVQ